MQDKKLYQKILGDALPLKNVKITHTPTIVGKLVEKSGMERFPDMFSRPLEICGQYLLLRTVIMQIKRRWLPSTATH